LIGHAIEKHFLCNFEIFGHGTLLSIVLITIFCPRKAAGTFLPIISAPLLNTRAQT
jgi:hypothetical protein